MAPLSTNGGTSGGGAGLRLPDQGISITKSIQQREGAVGHKLWADLGGASALGFLRHSCLPQAVPDIPPGGAIGLAVGLERSLMPRGRCIGIGEAGVSTVNSPSGETVSCARQPCFWPRKRCLLSVGFPLPST